MMKVISKILMHTSLFFRKLAMISYPPASRSVIFFNSHPYKEDSFYIGFRNYLDINTEETAMKFSDLDRIYADIKNGALNK